MLKSNHEVIFHTVNFLLRLSDVPSMLTVGYRAVYHLQMALHGELFYLRDLVSVTSQPHISFVHLNELLLHFSLVGGSQQATELVLRVEHIDSSSESVHPV